MKSFLGLFFLFSLFLAGSPTSKSELFQRLADTKSVYAELEKFLKSPAKEHFEHFIQLAEQTFNNVTERCAEIQTKIEQLQEEGDQDERIIVEDEINRIRQQIIFYHETLFVENSKIRWLTLAVSQCFAEDPELPPAAGIVRKVHDAVLKGHEAVLYELHLCGYSESEELWKKVVGNFLYAGRIVIKESQDLNETIRARWELGKARLQDARERLFASLPIETVDAINGALLNLAEYLRQKYLLMHFTEEKDSLEAREYFNTGNQCIDNLLIPVPKLKKPIHTEL